jgi:hypothetical protein
MNFHNLNFVHSFSIHVVFGHVIAGQAVVKQIEGLPVDRRSRPLQDAKVVNCGELVPKSKLKGIFVSYYFPELLNTCVCFYSGRGEKEEA